MKKAVLILLIALTILSVGCRKKTIDRMPPHLRPGSPEFLMNEGFVALNAGALDIAEKHFTTALKQKPDLVGALHGLGIVYLNKNQLSKAERTFKKSLQVNRENVDAHNYLGIIYTQQGKLDLAKEHFLIAANSDFYRTPENAFANLAMLEIQRKRFSAAKRYVERGMAKNNQFHPLLNAYGIVLEQEGKYTEAIFYYDRALSLLGKDDVNYLINLGRVYSIVGQKEKALDVLERAMALASSEPLKEQVREMIKKLGIK